MAGEVTPWKGISGRDIILDDLTQRPYSLFLAIPDFAHRVGLI